MKQLILHCGLHKTGTTALQNFLTANRDALLRHGVLYPTTGVPTELSGQHNIAWELGRMRQYRAGFGGIEELFAEIGGFEGRVIVSSEDFETSLLHPERWARIAGRAMAMGFEVLFVVYIRDVVPHLESVYLQKLRSGYGQEFSVAARTVMETGVLKGNDWEALFDRRAMVRAIGAIPGARLLLRHYDALTGGLTEADFQVALGLDNIAWDNPDPMLANMRFGVDTSIASFLSARNPWLPGEIPGYAEVVAALFEGKRVRLESPLRLQQALRARFMAEDEPRREPAADPDIRPLNIARVFSFETQVAFDRVFSLARDADMADREREARQEQLLRQWWDWVSVLD